MFVPTNAERPLACIPLFASLVVCLLPTRTDCWNFFLTGLPQDVHVSRFAVWRNRAFLAVPRHEVGPKSVERPTLLEAAWPEVASHSLAVEFPGSHDERIEGKCGKLLSARAVDADVRGRLWVLDVPNYARCPAKVVVYSLKRNNQKIVSADLAAVPTKSLRTIVIDPIVGHWGSRAYVGDPGDESIVVFSLEERRWWRLKLLRNFNVPRVFSADLAVSRRDSLLYLTGRQTHDMFCIGLDRTRDQEAPAVNGEAQNVTVTWLGEKLGASSGLLADHKDGLHYFLTSERASVRWYTEYQLGAESHSILLQDKDVPCITDYIADSQRNVWGLINADCSSSEKKNVSARAALKSRTVMVLKNIFGLR